MCRRGACIMDHGIWTYNAVCVGWVKAKEYRRKGAQWVEGVRSVVEVFKVSGKREKRERRRGELIWVEGRWRVQCQCNAEKSTRCVGGGGRTRKGKIKKSESATVWTDYVCDQATTKWAVNSARVCFCVCVGVGRTGGKRKKDGRWALSSLLTLLLLFVFRLRSWQDRARHGYECEKVMLFSLRV